MKQGFTTRKSWCLKVSRDPKQLQTRTGHLKIQETEKEKGKTSVQQVGLTNLPGKIN